MGRPNEQKVSQFAGTAQSKPKARVPAPGSSRRPYPSRFSFLVSGVRSVLRGEIRASAAARELIRRARAIAARRRERQTLTEVDQQKFQLRPEFQTLSPAELRKHFRERSTPAFLPGFELDSTAKLQHQIFPNETQSLLDAAQLIAHKHRWPLLGFGEQDFGEPINWHRDPLSGRIWPLDFHADIPLSHNDGSDVRVLWELNRMGHLITLGRAYAVSGDRVYPEAFLSQVESWHEQNPVGYGANWACAMEVALRAMNLLMAFALFRDAVELTESRLAMLLTVFDQHGRHIRRNLEFSHLGTSNHYLTNVVGLLWSGLLMPELAAAAEWREWALGEMLNEMDKQVLPDGAHYEGSTGYHRFVVELFLYSFALCQLNGVNIDDKYQEKLRAMLGYVRAYLRPDGRAPLIGDSDSGQVLPIVRHTADDHAYLLVLGAVMFKEPLFKPADSSVPEELLWILGEQGVRDYEALPQPEAPGSQAFPDAGTYVLRQDDLYLLLNANDSGKHWHKSHRHNDALSIELSACGSPFIVDPGTYVYTADLHKRHLFRSTAYHSTVQMDDAEQRPIVEAAPFAVGDGGVTRVFSSELATDPEVITSKFYYDQLPFVHRRQVIFHRRERYWVIQDELAYSGSHTFHFRFHLAPGLDPLLNSEGFVDVFDMNNSARLLIVPQGLEAAPVFEDRFSSNDYGAEAASISVCWSELAQGGPTTKRGKGGLRIKRVNFRLIPVASTEVLQDRLQVALTN